MNLVLGKTFEINDPCLWLIPLTQMFKISRRILYISRQLISLKNLRQDEKSLNFGLLGGTEDNEMGQ